MILVENIREAIKDLPGDAPLNLRLVNAPEGLEVEFATIERDGERVLITGEAFFPDEEEEAESE